MSISVDHARAKVILFEEADQARRGATNDVVESWRKRVADLGVLCPHGRSATVIAALGTALLAKATDAGVDVYSLLDRGGAPDCYSARSLADNVWARHRAELEVDLGANGVNPLNNTPFIGKTRIDEITGVRNQAGWDCFIECMEGAKSLPSSAEARLALRGFILARTRSLLPPRQIDPQAGDDLAPMSIVKAIERYVSAESEGGKRAQLCAAAILDAVFGADRVLVGVINDPDRHAPLDVSVTDQSDGYLMAFEVKDKPVRDHHIRSSIEKTVRDHGLMNQGFIAVSQAPDQPDFDDVSRWAAQHGVKITVFLDWRCFYLACKCFARVTEDVFEGTVFRRLLVRGMELMVDDDGLQQLRDIAV